MKKMFTEFFFIWKHPKCNQELWKNSGSAAKSFFNLYYSDFGSPWACKGTINAYFYKIEKQVAAETKAVCVKTFVK